MSRTRHICDYLPEPSINKTDNQINSIVDDWANLPSPVIVNHGLSYIYFIKDTQNQYIKIGYTSNNPLDRLKSIQTTSPLTLNLIGFIKGNRDIERSLHYQFKHLHIRGEWYTYHENIIKYIQQSKGQQIAVA